MRLDVSHIRKLFRYNPETGELLRYPHWKLVSLNAKGGKLASIEIGGVRYAARRVVWALVTGEWPSEKPHAIRMRNRNPFDLRWDNLYVLPDGCHQCAKCDQIKPITEFHSSKSKKPRVAGYCNDCKSATSKLRGYGHAAKVKKYGLTVADYDALFSAQGGVCAICKRPPDKKRLAVDHCHTTGTVRGLLCAPCNVSLGSFGDDPRVLLEAAKYLLRTSKHPKNFQPPKTIV